jgi:hypothetical protein
MSPSHKKHVQIQHNGVFPVSKRTLLLQKERCTRKSFMKCAALRALLSALFASGL